MNNKLNKDQFSRREVYGALSELFRYLFQDCECEFDFHDARKKFMEGLEGENNGWGFVVDVIRSSDTGKTKEIKQIESRQEAEEEEEKVIDKIEKDYNDKVVDGLMTGIENRDKEIQDLKQQLKEEKRLHQKCRDGLEGWSPPVKQEIKRLLEENDGLKQQREMMGQEIEWRKNNEEALGEEVQRKDQRIKELETKLGDKNKELRALNLDSDNSVKRLAELKETIQFWGQEAMRLEKLLRERDKKIEELKDQPKVEKIMKELKDKEEVAFPAGRVYKKSDIEQILKKHL